LITCQRPPNPSYEKVIEKRRVEELEMGFVASADEWVKKEETEII